MNARRVFVIAFLGIFLCTFSASAAVYYSPTVYVRPDPTYETYQAIGTILGSLINQSNKNAQARREAKQKQELQDIIANIRQLINKTAKNEADIMAKYAGEYGVTQTIKAAMTILSNQGIYSEVSSKDNTHFLYYERQISGSPKIEFLYALDREYGQCRVSVSIPDLNLQERQSSMFSEPRSRTNADNVSEYLGLVTAPQIVSKDGNFGIIVNDIVKGGIADFAGLKQGDMITEIDTYPLKDRSIEQVVLYISNRISQKARLNIKFIRGSSISLANIQL